MDLDADSGTSLLHEAACRKDLRLIELAVLAGADIRDRKVNMDHEGTGIDDRVNVFLRQCMCSLYVNGPLPFTFIFIFLVADHDKTLIPNPAPLTEPPVLKGYLKKYTKHRQ